MGFIHSNWHPHLKGKSGHRENLMRGERQKLGKQVKENQKFPGSQPKERVFLRLFGGNVSTLVLGLKPEAVREF